MKLIDKDALVAWALEELKLAEKFYKETKSDVYFGKINLLKKQLSFFDTFEVKEVNLEKAIDDYIYTHDGRKRLALELDWKCCNLTLKGGDEIIKFAKHFFELGMAAGNKAQKGE